ncbi:MAG: hypothetical protein KDE51_03175 [Anaerolineales bacterium]|nr:hypothetical protein [Anaerolineales bacterium]
MAQHNRVEKIIQAIQHIDTFEGLELIRKAVNQQVKKLKHHHHQVLYLVDKDNEWFVVTPSLNNRRKWLKIGKKLTRIETLQQTMLEPPMPEDDLYPAWEKWNRLANLPRTLEYCLSIEAAAELEKLEAKGFIIEIP